MTALTVAAGMGASMTAMSAPAAVASRDRADLLVSKVGSPPAAVRHGDSFSLGATVGNQGRAVARPTSLRFYLTKDRTRGGDDVLGGTVAVKKIRPGKRKTVSGKVAVPWEASGLYWVIACADSRRKVTEVKEGNNCRISKTQVDVDADIHAKLSGELTFLDAGQKVDPATGRTETWNRTGSASVLLMVEGDPTDPTFTSSDADHSTYARTGTVTVHSETANCITHVERTETGGAALKHTGDPFGDEIGGQFTKTDLSGVRIALSMRSEWAQTETATGKGDVPCDPVRKTSSGAGTIVSDIELSAISATAEAIQYRVVGWKGDGGTTSDWDKVEGGLTLTLR